MTQAMLDDKKAEAWAMYEYVRGLAASRKVTDAYIQSKNDAKSLEERMHAMLGTDAAPSREDMKAVIDWVETIKNKALKHREIINSIMKKIHRLMVAYDATEPDPTDLSTESKRLLEEILVLWDESFYHANANLPYNLTSLAKTRDAVLTRHRYYNELPTISFTKLCPASARQLLQRMEAERRAAAGC
jgi:hypothetical protein